MSQINQLAAQLEQTSQERDELKKIVDTMRNRMQGAEGSGNVGIFE
jgi:hypothetical protein